MKKITNFTYNDVVLYAKGWYQRTDNVFNDIKECIEEDNYYITWDKMSPKDICGHMLRCLDKIYDYLDNDDKKNGRWLCSHAAFLEKIEHNIKFYGNTYEEAIVYTVLSILAGLSVDEIELKAPKYGKGRRRIGGILGNYPISMTYKEMNKLAQLSFNKK